MINGKVVIKHGLHSLSGVWEEVIDVKSSFESVEEESIVQKFLKKEIKGSGGVMVEKLPGRNSGGIAVREDINEAVGEVEDHQKVEDESAKMYGIGLSKSGTKGIVWHQ